MAFRHKKVIFKISFYTWIFIFCYLRNTGTFDLRWFGIFSGKWNKVVYGWTKCRQSLDQKRKRTMEHKCLKKKIRIKRRILTTLISFATLCCLGRKLKPNGIVLKKIRWFFSVINKTPIFKLSFNWIVLILNLSN